MHAQNIEPYGPDIDEVGEMPTPIPDPHEIDVVDPTQLPNQLLDDLIHKVSQGTGCVITETIPARIMTLLFWPEFKIEWHNVTIDIGCGITIVIPLPVLLARVGKLVLWAYLGHVENLQPMVLEQLRVCLVNAAVSGGVTGIVTANPGAATAAFEDVFETQLSSYVLQDIKCLIPRLALLHEATQWV
jgi:hypothetical protein